MVNPGRASDKTPQNTEDGAASDAGPQATENDRFQFVFSTRQPGARSHAMRAFWRRRHSEQENQLRRNTGSQSSLRRILPDSRPSSSHGEAEGESASRLSRRTSTIQMSGLQPLETTGSIALGIPAQIRADIDHAFAFVRQEYFDQFPVQLTSQHKRLLYHWLCIHSEMLSDGQATRRFDPIRDIWLPLDLSNPASFYGLLAHSAAHLAYLYGERDSAEPLTYKSQAVSILNIWVNDPDRALNDDTFAAVLRLLIFEKHCGQEDQWAVHRDGLQRMIQANGRPAPFRNNWRLELATCVLSLVSGAEWINQVHPVSEICESFGYTLLCVTLDPIMDINRIRLESQKYPTVQEALLLLQTFSALNVHGPNLEGTYGIQGLNRLACLCTLLFMILEVTSPATNATLSHETQSALVSIDTGLWEARTQILFVDTSQSPSSGLLEKRKQRIASSHAARVAHARKRLRRTTEFQSAKALQLSRELENEGSQGDKQNSGNGKTLAPALASASMAMQSAKAFLSPLSQLSRDLNVSYERLPNLRKPLEHFLFHHYINSVIPWLNTHCKRLSEQTEYAQEMSIEWIRLAFSSAGFCSGILLTACRHLCMMYDHNQQRKQFLQHALQYKVACVQSLNASISSGQWPMIKDSVIAQVMILAKDEIILGDFAMARNHMQGATRIVEVNGGAQKFGLNGFIELLFHNSTMSDGKTDIAPGSRVLITGVNGYVASHIAKQLLARGYKVRGTVRDLERSSWLVKDAFKTYADNGDFELVTIKDFTAEGVYDTAIKGVSAIAHVASVVTFEPDPRTVISQTVEGATRIMEAALKEPSVKAVVYTSSIVAATMPMPGNSTHVDRNTWNEAATQLAWAPPPYGDNQGSIVYMASKVEAEKAVWRFVEEKHPHFRVNSVCPAMIMGEPLNDSHLRSVGAWVKQLWDGNVSKLAGFPATYHIDVKDVALLHVAAILDLEVNNQRLQAWAENCNWNDILAILRRLYPDRHFVDDLPGMTKLSITSDFTLPLALLEKWAGQAGWRTLEQTIKDNTKSIRE
ncbi:NAD dependent epimerase/dehydratase, putative [Paecilomyces variotii No. 5]|uniref:NAD dependent epimerase/dehydratase, putative n=1 Tax=Byssochlamys spectabilis (strain No. 5 / NBRC 109023) TaxID=1356009 RepID=V5GF13_BYSSN|nr:NAD dependent epimerase/dehydratase, putative [Paecilomyces variotii No. 5]